MQQGLEAKSERSAESLQGEGIGRPVRRKEDFRFITGRGRYTCDIVPHDALHAAGLKIRDIPCRGDPPVVIDLLGGQIDVAALVTGTANNPKLRVLGVFSSERNPAMPDVPTVKEQGFDVSSGSFGGLFAPLDTPKDVVAKLASACAGAAKDDTYAAAAKRAAQPTTYYFNASAFQRNLQADIAEKKKVIDGLEQRP